MINIPCNLCGADDAARIFNSPMGRDDSEGVSRYLASTDAFGRYGSIVRCRKCGLAYMNPRPPDGEILGGYSETVDEEYAAQSASRSINAHFCLHVIRKHAASGRLLDVGCSTGYFLNAARLWFDAQGVEPSAWASSYARRQLQLPVKTGRIEDALLLDRSLDVVTMIDVLEHLSNPSATLREAARVVKPGGLLYIVTPDIGSLSAKILRGKWWGLRPAHLYYFDRATLTAMLASAGFRVISVNSYGRIFTYRYWLNRLRNYPRPVFRAAEAAIRMFGVEDKFVYINTRDSLEVCALRE